MDAAGKTLAILFSQISGSAPLYESLGNRKAMGVVSKAMTGLKAAVKKHQGIVVKTVGDDRTEGEAHLECQAVGLVARRGLHGASRQQRAVGAREARAP